MNLRTPCLLLLLAGAAGCRDSADAMARDYRNLNNEFVDAIMMCTGEPEAKVFQDRVIKRYPDRIRSVDDRVKNWKQNNEKEEYATQMYTSDSLVILIVENEMNEGRALLEAARLKTLIDRLAAGGAQTPSLSALQVAAEKVVADFRKGTDLQTVLKEVSSDDKLKKNKKLETLKEAFEAKLNEFRQNHVVQPRQAQRPGRPKGLALRVARE